MYRGEPLTKEQALTLLSYGRTNPDYTNQDLVDNLGVSYRDADKIRYLLKNELVLMEVLQRKPKYRIFLGGDTHCGHLAGLTPDGYQLDETHPSYSQFAKFQRETWNYFKNAVSVLAPFSHAIFNGDLIDGTGKKSKGTELITSDRNIQAEMAVKVIETVGAEKNVITYGTPYHTGDGEQFEYNIAGKTDALLNAENLISIGGVVFNCKHYVAGSSTPYGSATPVLRDALWSDLWSQLEENPTADIVVRSHTHTFLKINDGFRTALVLPALQGAMTKYGTLRMSKIVHWGFAYTDIYENGTFEVHEILYNPDSQKRKVIEL